jgi:hypothetical protein
MLPELYTVQMPVLNKTMGIITGAAGDVRYFVKL